MTRLEVIKLSSNMSIEEIETALKEKNIPEKIIEQVKKKFTSKTKNMNMKALIKAVKYLIMAQFIFNVILSDESQDSCFKTLIKSIMQKYRHLNMVAVLKEIRSDLDTLDNEFKSECEEI